MLIVLVFIYTPLLVSNYINKHINKNKDNKTARRFCAVLAVSIYKCCDIAPALPRALFLYLAPLLVLLAVFSALFLYIQRITDKARRVSVAVWRLVAFPPVSAFLSWLVGNISTAPAPQNQTTKSGLPFQKIFFDFFYFSVGFFRVKGKKSSIFLVLEL